MKFLKSPIVAGLIIGAAWALNNDVLLSAGIVLSLYSLYKV